MHNCTDRFCARFSHCRGYRVAQQQSDEALAVLRRKLTEGDKAEGVGSLICHQKDGNVVTIEDVLVDSVSARSNVGIIDVEDEDGNVFHIPFVEFYTVSY